MDGDLGRVLGQDEIDLESVEFELDEAKTADRND